MWRVTEDKILSNNSKGVTGLLYTKTHSGISLGQGWTTMTYLQLVDFNSKNFLVCQAGSEILGVEVY